MDTEDEEDFDDLPAQLLSFKILLHPTRLAIMSMLERHYRIPSAEVRRLLGIPWGTFDTHLKRLAEADMLELKRDLWDGSPMIVLYLTARGDSRYREFRKIWDELQQ